MIGASILLVLLVLDGRLQQYESMALFAGVVAYTTFLVWQSRKETKSTKKQYAEGVEPEPTEKSGWDKHWAVQVGLVIAGLGLLVLGSELLVSSAVTIAKSLGVSDLVIGLTIVAAGTSLPEAATSVMAAARGQRDIAVGNVIGSNTFNILFCLGAAGSVSPDGLGMAPSVLSFDIWVMLGVAVITLPLFISGYVVTRMNALVLIGFYVAYTAYLLMQASASPALPDFADAMMRYVIPVSVVGLVILMVKSASSPKRTG
jgi:cation:H+ antiporter